MQGKYFKLRGKKGTYLYISFDRLRGKFIIKQCKINSTSPWRCILAVILNGWVVGIFLCINFAKCMFCKNKCSPKQQVWFKLCFLSLPCPAYKSCLENRTLQGSLQLFHLIWKQCISFSWTAVTYTENCS